MRGRGWFCVAYEEGRLEGVRLSGTSEADVSEQDNWW